MSHSPKVSVCTPVYNGAKFLDQCIRGVLNQTFSDFEYIIVDNASTDGTAEIIERYSEQDPRIKVYRNKSTVPVTENFNMCATHISDSCKWVKYALADDVLYPHCLEDMIKLGEEDSQIGIVSGYRIYDYRMIYRGLPVDQNIFDGADILKNQLLHEYHVCSGSPNSLMYRRSAFDELGRFNNEYVHADTDLSYRLLDKYKLGFIHDVLTWTGHHGERVEVASIKEGRNITEYLDFGFRKLECYKSVKLSPDELMRIKDHYAGNLIDFRIDRLGDFKFGWPIGMSEKIPPEVSSRYGNVIRKNFRRYLRRTLSVMKRSVFSFFRF